MSAGQLDLIVRGAAVYDGRGSTPAIADVAVANGRIVEVGSVAAKADEEIDATGLALAPGFIDVHSHSDFTLLVDPRALSSIHQGVTTEVIGNCGHGCFPLTDPQLARAAIYGVSDDIVIDWRTPSAYFERLERAKPAVNVAALVPNGQLRLAVVGMDARAATPDEQGAMIRHLDEGLEAGALGFSTGLEYAAERGASEAEVTDLCRTAARHGGLYATHARERDSGAVDAVAEALRTARAAGIRLQISHLLPRGGHDDCCRCIDLVETARSDGQDVAFDMHTRLFGLTFLHSLLPAWAYAAGAGNWPPLLGDADTRRRILAHRSILTASGNWRRVMLLDNDVCPQYARLDFEEIGRRRGQSAGDAALDILAMSATASRPLMAIATIYGTADQELAFSHPLCVPASDATALAPDGPLAGSAFHGAYTWAAWFWRFAVNERGFLSPSEAIAKLTGQPAEVLGFADRGRVAPGLKADLAIFDPLRFDATGTTFEPNHFAVGMHHVVVNGKVTLRDGAFTGVRAGEIIRRR
jgi:N-acyl-D-aspartate/D-glutamate deacylase